MSTKAVSAKIQGNAIYLYDPNGNYVTNCAPGGPGRTLVSATVNGNHLVVNTAQGNVLTYELKPGTIPAFKIMR